MRKFSGILFDLDGTLLHTAPEFKAALNQLLMEEKRSPLADDSKINVAVNYGIKGLIDLGFGSNLESAYCEHLKERLATHYFNRLGQMSLLFPGIEDCLEHLRIYQIPWGIVTNKYEKFTLPLVESIAQFKDAKVIVSGDTLAHAKPHPAPIHYACEKMGLCPTTMLYVGDAKRDMEAALAANMPCALATYGYLAPGDPHNSWGAHYYLAEAKELIKLLT